MLEHFIWQSSPAEDLLATASKLLGGDVPCPATKLARALRQAESSDCKGLLSDATIRERLAVKLENSTIEVSDKNACSIVDVLATVLEDRLQSLHAAAAPLVKALADKGGMPDFKHVTALLPSGQEPSEVLQSDWLLWHAVGHAHSPTDLPAPAGKVLYARLALAACASSKPLAACGLAMHVLENLDVYSEWETSIPGSKPAAAQCLDLKGQSVLFPLDKASAKVVAFRRVLANALPMEVSAQVAEKALSTKDVQSVLAVMTKQTRSRACIPRYVQPAVKEPKAAKEAKQSGGIGQLHAATATQELQWHLLAYRLRPASTLSLAARSASQPKKETKVPQHVAASKAGSGGPPLEGFAGIWAAYGSVLPPGHTEFSWNNAKADGMKDGFPTTWSPVGEQYPPGHTPYSWEKFNSSSGGAMASASASKPAKAGAKSNKPAAKSAATPAPEGNVPGEGTLEAALCKLDIRCGRIKECSKVPDADALYLLKVDVGEEAPRQVVSSLVKHYTAEELHDRRIIVYCNIKPGKMRNFESQAMVLAATSGKGTDDEKCELLAPPPDVLEGTRAQCKGFEVGCLSAAQSVKHISKFWNQVQPLLLTNEKLEATFDGSMLSMNKAPITTTSLAGVPIY